MPPCPSPSPRVSPSSSSLHQWCCPAISSSDAHLLLLPSIFPSIRDFSNESSVHIRWPKYWSFSFSISPSMNIQGWSPLRLTARFELLAVLAFRSLLQHHNLKTSSFWCSAFFMVQLSQSYVMTGKTIALTIQTFVSRVMSLLSRHCLGLTSLSCQEAIIFHFHDCNHHLPWFWSPRRENLSLLPSFTLLFAMQWWGQMPWS